MVGYTPDQGKLLTTDIFSAESDGYSIGNEELCWIDTVTKEWGIIEK